MWETKSPEFSSSVAWHLLFTTRNRGKKGSVVQYVARHLGRGVSEGDVSRGCDGKDRAAFFWRKREGKKKRG